MEPITFTEQEVLAEVGRLYMTNIKRTQQVVKLEAANQQLVDFLNQATEAINAKTEAEEADMLGADSGEVVELFPDDPSEVMFTPDEKKPEEDDQDDSSSDKDKPSPQ